MSKKKLEPDELQDQESAAVMDAMVDLGWLVPQNEAQVASAEVQCPKQPLPQVLRNPGVLLKRDTVHPKVVALSGQERIEISSTLARAAREGGAISFEIEQIMKRDREAAERKRQTGREDSHERDVQR
jgi:hypothetical protein